MAVKSLVIVLTGLLFIGLHSCKSRKEQAPTAETEVLAYEGMNNESVIITYNRTPCFGTCPHFNFTVFNNYECLYEGKNFVDSIGSYYSKITPEHFQSVLDICEEISYLEFNDSYKNNQVMDLPSTLTEIRFESKLKPVFNHYDGPKELVELYRVLDEVIMDLELIKTAH